MQSEKSRREFVADFFRLGGLFASVASWKAWFLIHRGETLVDDPISHRLLVTEPSELVDTFSNARGGAMVYQCQLFFPMYITGSEVEKIYELEKLCLTRIPTADPITQSRLRIIPAVAAANTLPSAQANDVGHLRKMISAMHETAASDKDPCRMTLALFWTCMTAVIQRNEYNWQRFTVGPEILNAAKKVCLLYVGGDDSTSVLLHSASAAWQFLQTYRIALIMRNESHAVQELQAVNECLEEVRHEYQPRYIWLDRIEEVCKAESYDKVLPEFMELIIGRSQFPPKSKLREAADLFVLLRLQHIYENHLVETGTLRSQYISNQKIAAETQDRAFAFLVDYGLRPGEWPHLRAQGKGMLTTDATRYFDNVFDKFDDFAGKSGAGGNETRYSEWFSRQVPFRRLPEEVVAGDAYDSSDVIEGLSEILKDSMDSMARLAFCMPAILHGIGLLAETSRDVKLGSEVAQTAAKEILQHPQYDDAFRLLATQKQQFRDQLNRTGASLKPLVYPRESESATESDDSLTISSARVSLAVKGEIHSPEERGNVDTPLQARSNHGPKVDLVGPLSLSLPMAGLFAAPYKCVKFPNEEACDRGFEILYNSGYEVEFLENDVFAVSSEKQLELLNDNKVPFEIVKKIVSR